MEIIGNRLRKLRETLQVSQAKMAELAGSTQTSINRFETGKANPPLKLLLWYGDYFDVSMDYIFGRTENPQGKLYDYEPEAIKEKAANNEELRQFVEMCFDPESPMSAKLKETLVRMMEERQE